MDLKYYPLTKYYLKKICMVKFLILFIAGMLFATTTINIISRGKL